MNFLFQLGHQPHISIAELAAVFSHRLNASFAVKTQNNNFLIAKTDATIDVQQLIVQLGGTVKIGVEIKNTDNPHKSIVHFLHTETSGKIHFSVSGDNAKRMGIAIKKELKGMGHSVRYVEAKNTATILHNNLVEKRGDFTIIGNVVFVTEGIQDIESFGTRDYGRPGFDEKSGMLPPKLARIMINLSGASPTSDTLLDAFCGSGTVLMEAATLGFKKIIGSDISTKAIEDSEKNMKWIKEHYHLSSIIYRLFLSDIAKLSTHLEDNSVYTIISEPYMGKPLRGNETKEVLQSQTRELAQLYIESFRTFNKILADNGTVIFIIPRFRKNNEWITIDCIEDIKNCGFETEPFFDNQPSLLYHREGQHVGREIFIFRKK